MSTTPAPSTTTTAKPAPPRMRCLRVGGREIPVVLPSIRDPRLRLSAVIFTLQILGQTVLNFKLSIAQILVTILTCAITEVVITYRRDRMLVWPASGILTGNSVAFILRASGTQPGDWWSLRGVHFFVLAAVISLLSKHLIRPNGRHLFNPSNVGIVWVLLVIGPTYVFPQYLWWGPFWSGGPAVAMAVIVVGGYWVLKKVRMIPMVLSFLATWAVLVGVFALAGRSFIAIWHEGPISGLSYWANLVLSPEVLVFVFFMISDPQTAPKEPTARIVYGIATAVVAAGLLYFQTTEFGAKLAILASLTAVCALVPLIQYSVLRWRNRRAAPEDRPSPATPLLTRLRQHALKPGIVAAVIIAVAAPVNTLPLVSEKQLTTIELGQTTRNPQ